MNPSKKAIDAAWKQFIQPGLVENNDRAEDALAAAYDIDFAPLLNEIEELKEKLKEYSGWAPDQFLRYQEEHKKLQQEYLRVEVDYDKALESIVKHSDTIVLLQTELAEARAKIKGFESIALNEGRLINAEMHYVNEIATLTTELNLMKSAWKREQQIAQKNEGENFQLIQSVARLKAEVAALKTEAEREATDFYRQIEMRMSAETARMKSEVAALRDEVRIAQEEKE